MLEISKFDKLSYLRDAGSFADGLSTCLKVAVGSVFVFEDESGRRAIHSCNSSKTHDCKKLKECLKFKLSGIYESREETRHFCAAKHSEIQMIEYLKSHQEIDISEGILFVTRYPCLNCATELAEAGIKRVIYGGRQEISPEVKKIFDDHSVSVEWYPEVDNEFF